MAGFFFCFAEADADADADEGLILRYVQATFRSNSADFAGETDALKSSMSWL